MAQFGSYLIHRVLDTFNSLLVNEWRLNLMKLDAGAWTPGYSSVWLGGLDAKKATFKGYAFEQLQNVMVTWDPILLKAVLTADNILFEYDNGGSGDGSNIVDGWALTYMDANTGDETFVCADHFGTPYVFSAEPHALPLKPHVFLFQA